MKGKCEKCGTAGHKRNPITFHHKYPKRHFGKYGKIVILCQSCHDKIERLIPFEIRSREFYDEITRLFLSQGV